MKSIHTTSYKMKQRKEKQTKQNKEKAAAMHPKKGFFR